MNTLSHVILEMRALQSIIPVPGNEGLTGIKSVLPFQKVAENLELSFNIHMHAQQMFSIIQSFAKV